MRDQDFKKLTIFQKYFQSHTSLSELQDFEKVLIKYFTRWRKGVISACNERDSNPQKKVGIIFLRRKMVEGSQMVELLNFSIDKPENFQEIFSNICKVFEGILAFRFLLKQIIKGPLENSLMQFCKKYPSKTLFTVGELLKKNEISLDRCSLFLEVS